MNKEKNKDIIINNKTYTWYNSLYNESKEGWIWIPDCYLGKKEYVKIKNKKNKKKIVVEARYIDDNFCKHYNSGNTINIENKNNSIVINEYYRIKLDINENIISIFDLKFTNFFLNKLLFLKGHVNPTVRITFWLATISILITVIGTIFSLVL